MKQFEHSAIQPQMFQYIDSYIDNFKKIKGVISDRLYGNPHIDDASWLSVVIPTFNRKELFREALRSVLEQQPVDYSWELLVIDNTPLDKSGYTPALEIVLEFNDPRVVFYHNRENIDTGYNWNRGVELARGDWICFLHDDDVLCPNALCNIRRQILSYDGKKPLGYLHARRQDFAEVFVPNPKKWFPPERLTRFGVLLSGCTGAGSPTCGTVIRKQAYIEVGGINYDFGLSADAVLCYQIMRDYAVVCSDRLLGGCRWRENDTLHKENILYMIRSDELLSRYIYNRSKFASWWGQEFGAASSWRNIHRKQKIAVQNKILITEEEFQAVTCYPKPRRCRRIAFLILYALHRLIRLVDGCIQELRKKDPFNGTGFTFSNGTYAKGK